MPGAKGITGSTYAAGYHPRVTPKEPDSGRNVKE
jgi:hypothetical protein